MKMLRCSRKCTRWSSRTVGLGLLYFFGVFLIANIITVGLHHVQYIDDDAASNEGHDEKLDNVRFRETLRSPKSVSEKPKPLNEKFEVGEAQPPRAVQPVRDENVFPKKVVGNINPGFHRRTSPENYLRPNPNNVHIPHQPIKTNDQNVKPNIAQNNNPAISIAKHSKNQNLVHHAGNNNNNNNLIREQLATAVAKGDSSDRLINGQPYPLIKDGNFIAQRLIVHLDLKGGPYKLNYFKELFTFLKKLNATGVLIEWEDMFPYEGKLKDAVNGNAYSKQDVRQILQWAKEAGLQSTPLVQTFGHLEWILKLDKYKHLREDSNYPQVICIGDDAAWDLVKDMVGQVVAVHKEFDSDYFHIGADEVFQTGQCGPSRKIMQTHGGRQGAIVWHIARTAELVRSLMKSTKVLVWHDMIESVSRGDMTKYNLLELVEPVLWNYAENLDQYLHPGTWAALEVFPYVWGASAYKGADGPMRYHSNPMHYIANHQSWLQQMNNHYRNFKQFRGMILTGWSRYDHLAVLCELLPVGIPALGMSIRTLQEGRGVRDYSAIDNAMGCHVTPDFIVRGCSFPGAKVYELINEFKQLSDQMHSSLLTEYEFNGWLSRTAEKYRYSSRMYLEKIQPRVMQYLQPMKRIERELRDAMKDILFDDAIEEFIYEYLKADIDLLNNRNIAAEEIMKLSVFQKRPFVQQVSGEIKLA